MASTTRSTNARIRELEASILAYEDVATQARTNGSFGPAVAAMDKANGCREDVLRLKAQAAIEKESEPLTRIQLQRQLALQGAAHTAAAHLTRTEADLLLGLAQANAQRAQAELSDVGAEDLVSMLISSLEELPLEDVALVIQACTRLLNPEEIIDDEIIGEDA